MQETVTIQQACETAISTRLDAEFFKALGDETRLAIVADEPEVPGKAQTDRRAHPAHDDGGIVAFNGRASLQELG